MEHVQVGGDVVLVGIASGPAVLLKEVVVFGVGNYVDSQLTVELKPFRPLPPLA